MRETDERTMRLEPGDAPPATDAERDGREVQAPAAAPLRSIDEDAVRLRAYERYLARGGAEGNEVEDWLAAERELTDLRAVRDLLLIRDPAPAAGATGPRTSAALGQSRVA